MYLLYLSVPNSGWRLVNSQTMWYDHRFRKLDRQDSVENLVGAGRRWYKPRVLYIHIFVYSPLPTAPPQKRKLPVHRVCTGQPCSSYTVPLNSKKSIKFRTRENTTFFKPAFMGCASPRSVKFPAATSQFKRRAVSRVYVYIVLCSLFCQE